MKNYNRNVIKQDNASWTADSENTSRTEAIISWKKAYNENTGASLDEFFG